MLDSYQSAAGVEIALSILTHRQLSPELRKQVSDGTLGAPAAKRAWTQEGMTLDISSLVGNINVPTTVIVSAASRSVDERHSFGPASSLHFRQNCPLSGEWPPSTKRRPAG
jgi:hypothetical protein